MAKSIFKIFFFALCIVLYSQGLYSDRYFYGHCGETWEIGSNFCYQYAMTPEDFHDLRGKSQYDNMHEDDIQLFQRLESLLISADEESRFVGLCFMLKIMHDQNKENRNDTFFMQEREDWILKKLLRKEMEAAIYNFGRFDAVEKDEFYLNKLVVMLILSNYRGYDEWLRDKMCRLLIGNESYFGWLDDSNVVKTKYVLNNLGVLKLRAQIYNVISNHISLTQLYVTQEDPLLVLGQHLAYNKVFSYSSNLDYQLIQENISYALHSEEEQERCAAWLLLFELCGHEEMQQYIQEQFLISMQDTPLVQMCAWLVSTNCSFVRDNLNEIIKFAYNAFAHEDWRVRFGGAYCLCKVLDFDDIKLIGKQCVQDKHECLQLLGVIFSQC